MPVIVPPTVLGPFSKGFFLPEPITAAELVAQGRTLVDGTCAWPVLALDGAAMAHNVATLAAFAREHGLALAPHGKTTMSPAVFRDQLAAGAWGMTVATGAQLLAAYSMGVRRLFVANEVVDPTVLRWVARTLDAEPATQILLCVDSVEGLDLLGDLAGARPFDVLVEVGHPGGRTGVRTRDAALDLARHAARLPGARVVGVSCYEGGLLDVASVRGFLAAVLAAAEAMAAAGLLPGLAGTPSTPDDDGTVVLSAGGSAYFDVVADVLGGVHVGGRPTTTLLRSGSYVTHDDGTYARKTPFTRIPGGLRSALRVWAQVSSRPEPDLAIVAMGKRDVPFDEGLPVPLRRHRSDSAVVEVQGWALTRTNDQHAYLEPTADTGPRTDLVPGDLLELGISHPCTAFDKWRVIPVVDDRLRIVDVLTTAF
ncbi:hypothetical protein [Cellulomonas hominis]